MSATVTRSFPETPSEGMSRLIPVQDERGNFLTPPLADAGERGRWLCAELEQGNILFFSSTPFEFPEEEREFLLGRKQTSAAIHKNIAYRPEEDRVTGLDKSDANEAARLRSILGGYSRRAAQFLEKLLPPYAGECKLDYASFRPIEERGRPARLRARNDLPHVDAFPTRPAALHEHQSRSESRVDHFANVRCSGAPVRRGYRPSQTAEQDKAGPHAAFRRGSGGLARCTPLTLRRVHAPLPQRNERRRGLPGALRKTALGISSQLDLARLHGLRESCGFGRAIRSRTDVHRFASGHGPSGKVSFGRPRKYRWVFFEERGLKR
jgi:hypothetical protein